MICLLNGHESSLWTLTLILYTCIWIPFLQMKSLLDEILGIHNIFRPRDVACRDEGHMWSPDLPVARFEDLDYPRSRSSSSNNDNDNDSVDDDCDRRELMCSVCLVEFGGEDAVSQLPHCGHVFHEECIQSWLDRNHFTCPLCRSSFLQTLNPKH
ncbi:hypothetical protein RHMOL_Rhmol05G0048100 [Rhododendron molle]|uniref:Uncharacterized protein n=1 Tax=Rhododendron molle TaxID=49168 RepID=A0ACC0NKG1_RHOML|nr:hypothetical protein RHMOL_Rhmol05G0048100 [Rhododendron molle]